MDNPKMYILVNSDINLTKEEFASKLAGQVGHVVEIYTDERVINGTDISKENYEIYKKERKKIILKCKKSKLEELEKEGYVSIRDLGYTLLEPNTLTCVNLGIFMSDEEVPKWVKRLRLY